MSQLGEQYALAPSAEYFSLTPMNRPYLKPADTTELCQEET
jgi:hypothetical protein